jgi:hypothetical protein
VKLTVFFLVPYLHLEICIIAAVKLTGGSDVHYGFPAGGVPFGRAVLEYFEVKFFCGIGVFPYFFPFFLSGLACGRVYSVCSRC